jgi:hypothetical protein
LPSVELGHARVAAVAIALHAIITLTILTRSDIQIGWVGLTPILITAFYIVAAIWFRRMPFLARPGLEAPKISMHKATGWSAGAAELSLGGVWARFGASALLILVSAPIVTLSVDRERSFVVDAAAAVVAGGIVRNRAARQRQCSFVVEATPVGRGIARYGVSGQRERSVVLDPAAVVIRASGYREPSEL